MTTQHTPGPWSLPHFVTAKRGAGECRCKYVLCEKYAGAICSVHFEDEPRKTIQEGSGDDPPLEEAKANARLIVASPSLMLMLQRLTEKTQRANEIQHSGGHISAEDWAELYDLSNEAKGLLSTLDGYAYVIRRVIEKARGPDGR